MNTPPKNDAAPLAGGAGVEKANSHPKPTAASVRMTPPARRNAPRGTSDEAARRIAGHSGTVRERILTYLRDRGPEGVTDHEGEQTLGIRPQTYTPRRRELVQLGLVTDSGTRRPTDTGRPAAAWIAAEHAERPEAGSDGVDG